jgi:hypothetical protein
MIDLMAGLAGIFLVVAVSYIASESDRYDEEIKKARNTSIKAVAEEIRRETSALGAALKTIADRHGYRKDLSVDTCEGEPCVLLLKAFERGPSDNDRGAKCTISKQLENDTTFYDSLRDFLAGACRFERSPNLSLRITFEGHTDEVPPGESAECGLENIITKCVDPHFDCCEQSFRGNLKLSARRAVEVFAFLRARLEAKGEKDLVKCLESSVTVAGRSWLAPSDGKPRQPPKKCNNDVFRDASSNRRSALQGTMRVDADRRVAMRFSLETVVADGRGSPTP